MKLYEDAAMMHLSVTKLPSIAENCLVHHLCAYSMYLKRAIDPRTGCSIHPHMASHTQSDPVTLEVEVSSNRSQLGWPAPKADNLFVFTLNNAISITVVGKKKN